MFPTVVKYMLKLFAMSVLSVQGTPLDVINVSVTVVFVSHFLAMVYFFSFFNKVYSSARKILEYPLLAIHSYQ